MRLNGNLVLNAGGLSEIQNAVVERVTSNPSFSASEKGRFIFRTDEGKVYYNDGVQWVAIATGGNAAALQAEVDSLEAALGAFITTSGSFDALGATLTNVTGATSVTNVIEQLDAAISSLNSALQTEVSRAQSAESQLQGNLDTETTARQAADLTLQQNINAEEVARIDADTALQAAIDTEVTARQAADVVLQQNINAEEAARIAADSTLTSNLAAEVTRAQNAETALQAAVDAETTARQAADSSLQAAIDAEAATRASADTALQTALTAEVSRAQTAESALSDSIAAETSAREAADLVHTNDIAARVKLAGDTMGGDLSFNSLYTVKDLRAPAFPGDAATKAYVDATAAGLSWQAPVVALGATLPLTATTGDRFVNTTDGKIYTATATDTWNAGVSPVDGWALFDSSSETGYVYSGTAWVQFTGTGQVGAGTGLSKDGNILNINLGAGIAELPSDEVGVDLFTGGGLFLTVDGSTADSSNAAQVAVKLDGDTITRTVSGIKVSDATVARITTLETGLTDEQAARSAADTLLQANIDTETTARQAADTILQTNINTEEAARIAADAVLQAAIDAEVSARTAAGSTLQSALDAEVAARQAADTAEASARAAADTALQAAIDSEASTRASADTALQAAIDAETTARTAADAGLQSSVDTINTKLGKIYFLYDGASATSHTVNHSLNQKYAVVTVIDSATDEVIIPQAIVFNTADQLTVTLNSALAIKVAVVAVGPLA